MNDTIPICKVTGELTLDGEDIYGKETDPVLLRARVGMVFQKPNPFPKSIYENVAYGPRIHGLSRNKSELDDIVITSLRKAGIYEEVKDRLDAPLYCQNDCVQPRGNSDGRTLLGTRSNCYRKN